MENDSLMPRTENSTPLETPTTAPTGSSENTKVDAQPQTTLHARTFSGYADATAPGENNRILIALETLQTKSPTSLSNSISPHSDYILPTTAAQTEYTTLPEPQPRQAVYSSHSPFQTFVLPGPAPEPTASPVSTTTFFTALPEPEFNTALSRVATRTLEREQILGIPGNHAPPSVGSALSSVSTPEFTGSRSNSLPDVPLILIPSGEEGGMSGQVRSLRAWFMNGVGGSWRDLNFKDVDPIIGAWL